MYRLLQRSHQFVYQVQKLLNFPLFLLYTITVFSVANRGFVIMNLYHHSKMQVL